MTTQTKKLIRYRIPVSANFPATHPRKKEQTHFVEKIIKGLSHVKFDFGISLPNMADFELKLHTIRGNYELWAKRFDKIERGDAVLELYTWEGKPYASKSVTVCQLGKGDGVGIQKLLFEDGKLTSPIVNEENWYKGLMLCDLAKNDGLSTEDFRAWFKGYDLSEPMCIIHFTKFRY